MLEKYLVEQCAPTLASLKTASLFSLKADREENLEWQLSFWNETLKAKGISIAVLHRTVGHILIYVYRAAYLEQDLRYPGVRPFLEAHGYDLSSVDTAISRLRERLLEEDGFPHEIGLFLGYPYEDVIGFIVNEGRNCKCVGCWKVYCNEEDAVKKFRKFQKCTCIYRKLWEQGRSLHKLTVAA